MTTAQCKWVWNQEFLKQVKGRNSLTHPYGAGEEWRIELLTDMRGSLWEHNSAARPVRPDLKYHSEFMCVGFLAFLCQDGPALELNTPYAKL